MKLKKVYIPMKGCKGHYVKVYELCEMEACSICNNIKDILSPDNPYREADPYRNQNIAIATANLKSHMASGKHWRLINTYYTGEASCL